MAIIAHFQKITFRSILNCFEVREAIVNGGDVELKYFRNATIFDFIKLANCAVCLLIQCKSHNMPAYVALMSSISRLNLFNIGANQSFSTLSVVSNANLISANTNSCFFTRSVRDNR